MKAVTTSQLRQTPIAMDDPNNLLLLFERPQEPVFLPKGDKKKKKVINAPPKLLVSKTDFLDVCNVRVIFCIF